MDAAREAPYRDALLDWMACAIGGAAQPAARAARAAGNGLLERVTAAGTAGHVLDYDDTYLPGMAHLSAATAPVALVLGAGQGASAADALAAYAAGFEAAGALGRAAHPGLYDAGWHPTAVCGTLGAAVTAARLLGLDEAQTRSAAGLSLLRSGGFRSAFGSAGKSLQVGLAASAGAAAAQLAAAGAEVDLGQIAAGPAGFEQVFGTGVELTTEGDAVTENWIKAYPCCLQTHGAIETALMARDAEAVSGGEPAGSVEVTVHPVSLQAAAVADPHDGLQAKFSIPYLTGFTLIHGAPGLDSFGEVDDDARRLGRRMTVRADAALSESEARLAIDTNPVARVEAALGSPQRPMDDEQLAAKRGSLAGERLEGALEDPERPAAELLALLEP